MCNSGQASGPAFEACSRLADALWSYGATTTSPFAMSAGAAGSSRSASPLVHSVWINFHSAADETNSGSQGSSNVGKRGSSTSRSNVILGSSWQLMHGPAFGWQRFGRADVALAPGSFVQVGCMLEAFYEHCKHPLSTSRLSARVCTVLALQAMTTLLECILL